MINSEKFGCSLVANLLIAYGYAKWTKAPDVEQSDVATALVEEDLSTEEESEQGESND